MKQIFNDNELNDKPIRFEKINDSHGTEFQLLIIFEDNSFFIKEVFADVDSVGYPRVKFRRPKMPKDIHRYGFSFGENPIAQELIRFGIMSLDEFKAICQAADDQLRLEQENSELLQLKHLAKKYPHLVNIINI